MQHKINRLAEFKDKTRENEFYNIEVGKGLRISRNTILWFSVINLLFVISDYLYLKYENVSIVIYYSLVPRIVILAMAIAVFILLKKVQNKITAIKSVIIFTLLMYLLHEYTAIHFAPVDLIFEVLDLALIAFGLFIIPNRWIVNVITSASLIAVFLVLTPFTIPTMNQGTKVIISIYLYAHILIVGILMHRINTQRRLNYLQQLQLEMLAQTDALTKSTNRAACEKTLERMCKTNYDFSLILIDLDDFKYINDQYGHLAGDEVLVKTIDTIKKVIREDDIIARWGGEEFVIILPRTACERATEMAQRLQGFIATIEYEDNIGMVTASFGVTAFIEGDDTKSIISRADKLLYIAKKHGKNRVVSG